MWKLYEPFLPTQRHRLWRRRLWPKVWGLCFSADRALLGTPLYLAPELWRSETAASRSDLYSLGVLLCELYAGRTPDTAESIELFYLNRAYAETFLIGAHAG